MQRLKIGKLSCLLASLLLLVEVGCGGGKSGPELATVKGTIKLDGQPVDGGSITFQSATQAAGGGVKNGEFHFKGESGIPVGQYAVRINWLKPTGKKVIEPDSGQETDEVIEAIPAKYNTQTGEKATINSGENALSFDLKSK